MSQKLVTDSDFDDIELQDKIDQTVKVDKSKAEKDEELNPNKVKFEQTEKKKEGGLKRGITIQKNTGVLERLFGQSKGFKKLIEDHEVFLNAVHETVTNENPKIIEKELKAPKKFKDIAVSGIEEIK